MGVKAFALLPRDFWPAKACCINGLRFGASRIQKSAFRRPAGLAALWISLWKAARGKLQTACKPGSVRALRHWAAIPLGRASPRASRDQPGWRGGNAPGRGDFAPGRPSLFGLAPGGVYPATPVTGGAVRSCRTVSPLPSPMVAHGGQAVCFLWHFPWGRPRRPLAGTVFPWSPDFPRHRLRGTAAARPSGGVRMAGEEGEGKARARCGRACPRRVETL